MVHLLAKGETLPSKMMEQAHFVAQHVGVDERGLAKWVVLKDRGLGLDVMFSIGNIIKHAQHEASFHGG